MGRTLQRKGTEIKTLQAQRFAPSYERSTEPEVRVHNSDDEAQSRNIRRRIPRATRRRISLSCERWAIFGVQKILYLRDARYTNAVDEPLWYRNGHLPRASSKPLSSVVGGERPLAMTKAASKTCQDFVQCVS